VGQSRSGRGSEEEISLHCPCGESKPGRPARNLVTVLTQLSQLLKMSYLLRL